MYHVYNVHLIMNWLTDINNPWAAFATENGIQIYNNIFYRVSQKKVSVRKNDCSSTIFGPFSFPRTDLESSGSEEFKTVLIFQNWSKSAWVICCQSCQPQHSVVDKISNGVCKFNFFLFFFSFSMIKKCLLMTLLSM